MKITIDTNVLKIQMLKRLSIKQDFFPPSRSLLSLPIVRFTIGVILLVSLLMTIGIVVTTSRLTWDFTDSGYRTAAQIFKAPIALVLLLIPVVALLASNHRSVQTMSQMNLTTTQIELTTGQNLFANYYKHIEEFSKWCDHIEGIGEVKSKRKLHKKLFPTAQSGDFQLPAEILMQFSKYGSEVERVLLAASSSHSLDELANLRKINLDFARDFWMTTPPYETGATRHSLKFGMIFLPLGGVRGFIQQQIDFIRAVDELFSFDSTYHTSPIISKLLNLSLAFVSDDPNRTRITFSDFK